MKRNQLVLSTLAGAFAASGISIAAFEAEVVPPFRGQVDTEFSGWEKMTVPFGGVNTPDDLETTSDDATLTQTVPGAILTSTCNIYSPAAAPAFTIADTVPGDLTQVYLQTRTLGSPLAQSALLSYTDGQGMTQSVAANVTVLLQGGALELLFVWDLSANPDTILSYTIDFGAVAANCSLDTVLLDSNFGDVGVGTSYCTGAINSTGGSGTIRATGSASVAANSFGLLAEGVPPGVPGLFTFGPNQIQAPFGDGFRCVGGATRRIQPPAFADGLGNASKSVDLTAAPAAGLIVPAAVMNFQFWHRDPMGPGGTGFNLTDAVNVVFL